MTELCRSSARPSADGITLLIQEHLQPRIADILRFRQTDEWCALLCHDPTGTQVPLPLRNQAGAGRFLVTRETRRRAVDHAHRSGLTVDAFVHSHPQSADLRASELDVRAASLDVLPWVIVSLSGDGLAWLEV